MLHLLRVITLALLTGVLLVLAYLQLSMSMALDYDRHYSSGVDALPRYDGIDGLVSLEANSYTFRLRLAGFQENPSAPAVVLLHGFPTTSAMWLPLVDPLVEAGYRVVAPDQRGYSPGARPEGVGEYQSEHLVRDIVSIANALGLSRFHLVGHDWGAMVGWRLAQAAPERLYSWTALSLVHPAAFAEAIENDPEQRSSSRYMQWFKLPWLPEALMARNGFASLRQFGEQLSAEQRDEYLAMFREPGATAAALNWYRALPASLTDLSGVRSTVQVPTLFIWGNRDPLVSRYSLEAQREYMGPDYRELELEAGHRPIVERSGLVLPAILAHLRR